MFFLFDPIWWAKLGAICGGIIAAVSAIGLLWTKVVRPMWRGLMKLGDIADLIAGDPVKKIPSLSERLDVLAAGQVETNLRLDDHQAQFHTPRQQANGSRAITPVPRRPR